MNRTFDNELVRAYEDVQRSAAARRRRRYFDLDDLEHSRRAALDLLDAAGTLLLAIHKGNSELAAELERSLRSMLKPWNGVIAPERIEDAVDETHVSIIAQISVIEPIQLSGVEADCWCRAIVNLAFKLVRILQHRTNWDVARAHVIEDLPTFGINEIAEQLEQEFDDVSNRLEAGQFEPTKQQILERCGEIRRRIDNDSDPSRSGQVLINEVRQLDEFGWDEGLNYFEFGWVKRDLAEVWEDLRRMYPLGVLPIEPLPKALVDRTACQSAVNEVIAFLSHAGNKSGASASSDQGRRRDRCTNPTVADDNDCKLLVEKWTDLAIGVDEDGGYWAISPVPMPGARFRKEQAVQLKLPGKQWRVLLELLARSEEGRTARRRDLLHKFQYYTLRIEQSNAEHNVELHELASDDRQVNLIKKANAKLATAIADLSRKLCRQVMAAGHKRRVNIPLTAAAGDVVHAQFTTRFLLRNSSGTLTFGEPIR